MRFKLPKSMISGFQTIAGTVLTAAAFVLFWAKCLSQILPLQETGELQE